MAEAAVFSTSSSVTSSPSHGVVFNNAQGLRWSPTLEFRLLYLDRNKFWSLSVTGGFFKRCCYFENFDPQSTACYVSILPSHTKMSRNLFLSSGELKGLTLSASCSLRISSWILFSIPFNLVRSGLSSGVGNQKFCSGYFSGGPWCSFFIFCFSRVLSVGEFTKVDVNRC